MGTGRCVRVVTNPNARIRAIRHVQNEFYRQETSKGLRKEQQAGQVKRMAPFFNKKKEKRMTWCVPLDAVTHKQNNSSISLFSH